MIPIISQACFKGYNDVPAGTLCGDDVIAAMAPDCHTLTDTYAQVGPVTYNDRRPLYATFVRICAGVWQHVGLCLQGDTISMQSIQHGEV